MCNTHAFKLLLTLCWLALHLECAAGMTSPPTSTDQSSVSSSTVVLPSGQLPPLRARHAVAFIDTLQELVVFGGSRIDDEQLLDDVWSFQPFSREWHRVEKPTSTTLVWPGVRAQHSLTPVALGASDLLLFGGLTDNNILATDDFLFDAARGTWTHVQFTSAAASSAGSTSAVASSSPSRRWAHSSILANTVSSTGDGTTGAGSAIFLMFGSTRNERSESESSSSGSGPGAGAGRISEEVVLDDVWRYDSGSNPNPDVETPSSTATSGDGVVLGTWRRINTDRDAESSKPEARTGQAASAWSTQIFVFGGRGVSNVLLEDFWSFDTVTEKWTRITTGSTSPSPRTLCSAVTLGSSIVFISGTGLQTGGTSLREVWSYGLFSHLWTMHSMQEQQYSAYGHTATSVSGHRALLLGGFDTPSPSITSLDWHPFIANFTTIESNGISPQRRHGHVSVLFARPSLVELSTLTSLPHANKIDATLVVFGGLSRQHDHALRDLWSFDMSSSTWRSESDTSVEPSDSNNDSDECSTGAQSGLTPPASAFGSMVRYDNFGILFGGHATANACGRREVGGDDTGNGHGDTAALNAPSTSTVVSGNELWALNSRDMSWSVIQVSTQMSPRPAPRSGHAAALVSRFGVSSLFVYGGVVDADTAISSLGRGVNVELSESVSKRLDKSVSTDSEERNDAVPVSKRGTLVADDAWIIPLSREVSSQRPSSDRAMKCDGKTVAAVKVTGAPIQAGHAVTITLWFQVDSLEHDGSTIVAWGSASTSVFSVYVDFFRGTLRFVYNDPSIPSVLGTTSVVDHQWHHLALTLDLSNPDGSALYVDNQLDASFSTASLLALRFNIHHISLGSHPAKNYPIVVPAVPAHGNKEKNVYRLLWQTGFMGKIDDLRLWKGALSLDQITVSMFHVDSIGDLIDISSLAMPVSGSGGSTQTPTLLGSWNFNDGNVDASGVMNLVGDVDCSHILALGDSRGFTNPSLVLSAAPTNGTAVFQNLASSSTTAAKHPWVVGAWQSLTLSSSLTPGRRSGASAASQGSLVCVYGGTMEDGALAANQLWCLDTSADPENLKWRSTLPFNTAGDASRGVVGHTLISAGNDWFAAISGHEGSAGKDAADCQVRWRWLRYSDTVDSQRHIEHCVRIDSNDDLRLSHGSVVDTQTGGSHDGSTAVLLYGGKISKTGGPALSTALLTMAADVGDKPSVAHIRALEKGPSPRFDAASSLSKSAFTLFGGSDTADGSSPLNDLWRMDLSSQRWVKLTTNGTDAGTIGGALASAPYSPYPRTGHTLINDDNDRLWVFGGMECPPGQRCDLTNDVSVFQPNDLATRTGQWRERKGTINHESSSIAQVRYSIRWAPMFCGVIGDPSCKPGIVNWNYAYTDSAWDTMTSQATDGNGTVVASWTTTGALGSDKDIFFSRSTDYGMSWETARALLPALFADDNTIDDDQGPVVQPDDRSLVYLGNRTFAASFTRQTDPIKIWLALSTNNGMSWDTIVDVTHTHVAGARILGFDAIGLGAPGTVLVYWATVSELSGEQDFMYARSTDNGRSFGSPKYLLPIMEGEDESEQYGLHSFRNDRTGTIIVGFSRGKGGYYIALSHDDGVTFVETAALRALFDTPALTASYTVATLVVDPTENLITMAFQARGNQADFDIYSTRSMDDGVTWTPLTTANPNAATDVGNDFYPKLYILSTGLYACIYYTTDSIGGTIGADRDVLIMWSQDKGLSWSNPTPVHISAGIDAGQDRFPSMIETKPGVILALWTSNERFLNGPDLGSDRDIMFGLIDLTLPQPFCTAVVYDGPAHDGGIVRLDHAVPRLETPALVAGRNGVVVLIWSSRAPCCSDSVGNVGTDGDIMVSVSIDSGLTWTAAKPLHQSMFTDSVDEKSPSAAFADGLFVCVWERHEASGEIALAISTSSNGFDWSAPNTAATPLPAGSSIPALGSGIERLTHANLTPLSGSSSTLLLIWASDTPGLSPSSPLHMSVGTTSRSGKTTWGDSSPLHPAIGNATEPEAVAMSDGAVAVFYIQSGVGVMQCRLASDLHSTTTPTLVKSATRASHLAVNSKLRGNSGSTSVVIAFVDESVSADMRILLSKDNAVSFITVGVVAGARRDIQVVPFNTTKWAVVSTAVDRMDDHGGDWDLMQVTLDESLSNPAPTDERYFHPAGAADDSLQRSVATVELGDGTGDGLVVFVSGLHTNAFFKVHRLSTMIDAQPIHNPCPLTLPISAPVFVGHQGSASSASVESVTVVNNNQGTWIVAWNSADDVNGTGPDLDLWFVISKDDGTSWSVPDALNRHAWSDTSIDRNVRIAFRQGVFMAVWESAHDIGGAIGIDIDVLFATMRDDETVWSVAAPLPRMDPVFDSGEDIRPVVVASESHWMVSFGTWGNSGRGAGTDGDIWSTVSYSLLGREWEPLVHVNVGAATDQDSGTMNDQSQSIAGVGDIWVATWMTISDTDSSFGPIAAARTMDGGKTWSPEIELSPAHVADMTTMPYDPSVATDGHGVFIVVFEAGKTPEFDEEGRGIFSNPFGVGGGDADIYCTVSLDYGNTWSAPLNIIDRIDSVSDRGADIAYAKGMWVVTWMGDGTVFAAWSSDSGTSWSAPQRISDLLGGDDNYQRVFTVRSTQVAVLGSEYRFVVAYDSKENGGGYDVAIRTIQLPASVFSTIFSTPQGQLWTGVVVASPLPNRVEISIGDLQLSARLITTSSTAMELRVDRGMRGLLPMTILSLPADGSMEVISGNFVPVIDPRRNPVALLYTSTSGGSVMLVHGGRNYLHDINELLVLDLGSEEWSNVRCKNGEVLPAAAGHSMVRYTTAAGADFVFLMAPNMDLSGTVLVRLSNLMMPATSHLPFVATIDCQFMGTSQASTSTTSTSPPPRLHSSAVTIGNRILVFGGLMMHPNNSDVNSVWSYHVPSDQWRQEAYVSIGARQSAEAFAIGHHLYLMGGVRIANDQPTLVPQMEQYSLGQATAFLSQASGSGLSTARAGVPQVITVNARDAFDELTALSSINVELVGPVRLGGSTSVIGSMITVTYTPQISGVYELRLVLADSNLHICGSPFSVEVLAGETSVASCVAVGSALTLMTAGTSTSLRLFAKDRFSNPAIPGDDVQGLLAVKGSNEIRQAAALNLQDGSYRITMSQTRSGDFEVSILVDQMHVPGSPFALFNSPGDPNAPNSIFTGVTDAAVSGQGVSMKLQPVDRYGNRITLPTDTQLYSIEFERRGATPTATARSASSGELHRYSTTRGDARTDTGTGAGALQSETHKHRSRRRRDTVASTEITTNIVGNDDGTVQLEFFSFISGAFVYSVIVNGEVALEQDIAISNVFERDIDAERRSIALVIGCTLAASVLGCLRIRMFAPLLRKCGVNINKEDPTISMEGILPPRQAAVVAAAAVEAGQSTGDIVSRRYAAEQHDVAGHGGDVGADRNMTPITNVKELPMTPITNPKELPMTPISADTWSNIDVDGNVNINNFSSLSAPTAQVTAAAAAGATTSPMQPLPAMPEDVGGEPPIVTNASVGLPVSSSVPPMSATMPMPTGPHWVSGDTVYASSVGLHGINNDLPLTPIQQTPSVPLFANGIGSADMSPTPATIVHVGLINVNPSVSHGDRAIAQQRQQPGQLKNKHGLTVETASVNTDHKHLASAPPSMQAAHSGQRGVNGLSSASSSLVQQRPVLQFGDEPLSPSMRARQAAKENPSLLSAAAKGGKRGPMPTSPINNGDDSAGDRTNPLPKEKEMKVWTVKAGLVELEQWQTKVQGYKDLAFFLMFFTLYLTVQMLQQDISSSFTVNSGLRATAAGFDEVGSPEDFWKFLLGMAPNVFPDSWYSGQELVTSELGYIQFYNKLIGGVLVVQHRADIDSCGDDSLYSVFYGSCHTSGTSTEPFGAEGRFQYSEQYQAFTFFLSVSQSQKQVVDTIEGYRDSLWIDKSTRRVSVKFATYNGELSAFSFVRIVFNFGRGGIFDEKSSLDIQSAKLELYRSNADYAKAVLELLLVFFIMRQVMDEILDFYDTVQEAKTFGAGVANYFSSFWNFLDLSSLSFLTSYIVLRLRFVIFVYHNPIILPSNRYEPAVEEAAQQVGSLLILNSLSILIAITRLFKYFEFQPRMRIISLTLANAVSDMFHFMILYFLILLGFSSMAMLLFGSHLLEYSTIGNTLQTMGEQMLGNFDFQNTKAVDAFMATVLFWSFTLIVFFVMVNVFLAILIDAYADAKNHSEGAVGIATDMVQWARTLVAEGRHGSHGVVKSVQQTAARKNPVLSALRFFQHQGMDRVYEDDIEWYLSNQCGLESGDLTAHLKIMANLPGRITDEEESPSMTVEQLMRAAWTKYDADGSDTLSRDEFANFMADAPVKVQGQQVDTVMNEADKNGDGVITWDEFVPLFEALLSEVVRVQVRGQ